MKSISVNGKIFIKWTLMNMWEKVIKGENVHKEFGFRHKNDTGYVNLDFVVSYDFF